MLDQQTFISCLLNPLLIGRLVVQRTGGIKGLVLAFVPLTHARLQCFQRRRLDFIAVGNERPDEAVDSFLSQSVIRRGEQKIVVTL